MLGIVFSPQKYTHHQQILLKFKEKNENGMTFCYFSCLGRYCLRLTSMAALQLLMLAPCHQMILVLQILIQSVDFH